MPTHAGTLRTVKLKNCKIKPKEKKKVTTGITTEGGQRAPPLGCAAFPRSVKEPPSYRRREFKPLFLDGTLKWLIRKERQHSAVWRDEWSKSGLVGLLVQGRPLGVQSSHLPFLLGALPQPRELLYQRSFHRSKLDKSKTGPGSFSVGPGGGHR